MRTRHTGLLAGLAAALAASPVVLADDDDDEEIPFDVAEIFFELNDTDGDLGIHALIDGEPWKRLTIEDQRERKVLNVYARGRVRQQGLTEIFFESAEPPFESEEDPSEALPPEEFFERFPPGIYEIEGRTLDGEELESETEITHAMPAPPTPTVNGEAVALDCDDEKTIPEVSLPVVISWPAVTTTHPGLGNPQGGPITIHNYQVVVEAELEPVPAVFSVTVPPGVTSMTVPPELLALSDEFKYEVLAREESWNQTAVESCFLFAE